VSNGCPHQQWKLTASGTAGFLFQCTACRLEQVVTTEQLTTQTLTREDVREVVKGQTDSLRTFLAAGPIAPTPAPYLCPRCTADPQPPQYAKRQCLFNADGTFREKNWNCATEWALQEAYQQSIYASVYSREDHGELRTVYGTDESMHIYPCFPSPDEDDVMGNDPTGWLIFTRYKRRGRTSNVVWVGDFSPARPVTRALIESTITKLQSLRAPEPTRTGTAH
jgi:hypothetical protein